MSDTPAETPHIELVGAEAAFEAVARELAAVPNTEITLIGSGAPRPDTPYRFLF